MRKKTTRLHLEEYQTWLGFSYKFLSNFLLSVCNTFMMNGKWAYSDVEDNSQTSSPYSYLHTFFLCIYGNRKCLYILLFLAFFPFIFNLFLSFEPISSRNLWRHKQRNGLCLQKLCQKIWFDRERTRIFALRVMFLPTEFECTQSLAL